VGGVIDATTVAIFGDPVNGTATVDANGIVTYINNGTGQSDLFTYTVDDDSGNTSNVATVNVTIDGVGPVANDDELTVALTQTETVDLIANDTDMGGVIDGATLVIIDFPTLGTATNNFDGTVDYENVLNGSSDSFTYRVDDDSGNVSNTATVDVTITGSSVIPQSGLIVQLESDSGVVTDANSIVQSWADQSGGDNSLLGIGDPELIAGALNGLDVIDLDGTAAKLETTTNLTGLPAGSADRTVFAVINYRSEAFGGVAYGTGGLGNQTFGLVTNGVGNLTVSGWADDEESQVRGLGIGWLTQSAVVDNNQLTHFANGFEIDDVPHTYNTVVAEMVIGEEIANFRYIDMQIAAVLVYDRALSGSERITVENYLQDKYFGGSPSNLPPTAVNDTLLFESIGATTLDLTGNDLDVDGTIDGEAISIVSAPAGSISDNGDGTLDYTPVVGATTDTFTYTVNDNDGDSSNVATVTLTVDP
jgi:hypothetical protein